MHVRSLNEKLASGKFAPDSVELKVRTRAPSTIHEQQLADDHHDLTIVGYVILQGSVGFGSGVRLLNLVEGCTLSLQQSMPHSHSFSLMRAFRGTAPSWFHLTECMY